MSERLMILKMLDEGKITLEEADALLEALGHDGMDLEDLDLDDEFIKLPKAPEAPKAPQRPEAPKVPEVESDREEEMEDLWEDELDQIEDKFDALEDEVDALLDEVVDHLSDLEDEIEALDEALESGEIDEQVREEKLRVIEEQREQLEEKKREYEERQQKFHDQRKEFNQTYKSHKGFSFDFNEGVAEIKRAFEEIKSNFHGEEFKAGMKEFTEQFSEGMKEGMKELKEGLEEGTKEVKKAFEGKDFKQVLGNLFKNFGFNFGPGIPVEEEITGHFDPEEGPILIDLSSNNGRIEVEGTDDDEYKLCLKYSIHASSEEEAYRLKDEMTNLTQSPTLLQFSVERGHIMGGVRVKLYLPNRVDAELKLKTSNGRITLEGLQQNSPIFMKSSNGRLVITDTRAQRIEAKTSNGRIELKDFAAEELDVKTSNGSIFIEGLCNNVVGRTSNGSVTIHPYVSGKGDLDVQTSNGKIKVLLTPELAADLDAKTSMGSITFNLPDLVYQKQVDKHGRKEYQAQSNNYIGSEKRIQILARTSMGSIFVGNQE